MRSRVIIEDIDLKRNNAEAAAGVGFLVASDSEQFRRWRPALVRSDIAREFLDRYFRHVARMPWAGLICLDDVRIFGEGLIVQGDSLYVGDSLMYPRQVFPYAHSTTNFDAGADGSYEVEIPDQTLDLKGLTATVVCDGWPIYGHWLVDVLPRLHRVMSAGLSIDQYLFPGPEKDWQVRILETLGVEIAKCRFVDFGTTTVTCERVVVPTYDRFNSEVRPALMDVHRKLRDIALKGNASKTDRDLFVSRGHWGGSRPLFNRQMVESIFSDLGFEIVRPELFSFEEQIKLFASARSVAGECGSGMHNAIFSGAGTKVVLLQSAANYNFLQSQIAMLCGHEVYYVLGSPSDDRDGFTVDLQDARYVAGIVKGQRP